MIICEVGQNFCGDIELAKKLICLAKENGADLVKFQLYDHNRLYGNSDIPNVELSFDQAKVLFDFGKEVGIEVFFSVFDVERVKWCEEIGVKRYKIASHKKRRDVYQAIGATNKPVIISYPTDRSNNFWGIEAKRTIKADCSKLVCPAGYPAFYPVGEVIYAGDIFYYWDGLSDHSIGLHRAKSAIDWGAKIIEKHFAIDHETGVDAKWSMTPDELKELSEYQREGLWHLGVV